jgi:hypothetical protein
MNNIRSLIILLIALCVSACANMRKEPAQAYDGHTLPFLSKDVQGWRYNLVSSERIFSIRFSAGGYAPATIGSGNVVAAPSYKWEIDDHHCLRISDGEGVIAAYQLLSLSRNTVTVWDRIEGQAKVFTRQQET